MPYGNTAHYRILNKSLLLPLLLPMVEDKLYWWEAIDCWQYMCIHSVLEGPLRNKNAKKFFWDSERVHKDEHFTICQHFFLGRDFLQLTYLQSNDLFIYFSYLHRNWLRTFWKKYPYLVVKCTSEYSCLAEDTFRAFFTLYSRTSPLSFILNFSIPIILDLSPYPLLNLSIPFTIDLSHNPLSWTFLYPLF